MVAEAFTAKSWTEVLSRGAAAKRAVLRMEGGVLSAEAFGKRLGVAPGDLENASLFWLEENGDRMYPAFQLSDGGLLPGIGQE